MRDSKGLDHPSAFQFDLLSADMIEQSPTIPEQYGHEVYLQLVKKPSLYELLNDIGAACHRDIFVTCGCFCLPEGAFDSVRDEGKGGSAFLEYGHVKGRVITPISFSKVEHSSAHHDCPCILE